MNILSKTNSKQQRAIRAMWRAERRLEKAKKQLSKAQKRVDKREAKYSKKLDNAQAAVRGMSRKDYSKKKLATRTILDLQSA